MNIKSLLLGSAAALAAVSFAHAAEIVPGGGGGCATQRIVAETRSLEIGIITSDPFELASNETGLISPDPIQLLAELPQGGLIIEREGGGAYLQVDDTILVQRASYPDGHGIKAEGWGGVVDDKQLTSLDVGIIDREGDGGTKKPIPPSGVSTQTRI